MQSLDRGLVPQGDRSRVATLAAYTGMMRRDRERLGLRECRATWLLGLTVGEDRALEAGRSH